MSQSGAHFKSTNDQKKESSGSATSLVPVSNIYMDGIRSAEIRSDLLYLKMLLAEDSTNQSNAYATARELLKSVTASNIVMHGDEFIQLHDKILKLFPDYLNMIQPFKDKETLKRKPNKYGYEEYGQAAYYTYQSSPESIVPEYLKLAAMHSLEIVKLVMFSDLCLLLNPSDLIEIYYAQRCNWDFYGLITDPNNPIMAYSRLTTILDSKPDNSNLIHDNKYLQQLFLEVSKKTTVSGQHEIQVVSTTFYSSTSFTMFPASKILNSSSLLEGGLVKKNTL